MAGHLDPQDIENASKQLLEDRMNSVRDLVAARNHHSDKADELNTAAAADKLAHDAALAAGWAPDELRKIGLPALATKATRSSARTRRTRPRTTVADDPAGGTGD